MYSYLSISCLNLGKFLTKRKEILVKIIGTSTCDIMVVPEKDYLQDIPGVAGIVNGSVLPGYIGIEAGQSAVGDIFNWYVSRVLNQSHEYHQTLTENARGLKAGEIGMLSLDWNNGNRNVLADFNLSGLLVGQTLHSRDFEIYRALIEATAFGALKIIDRMEEYGIQIKKVINCGGIAENNDLVMQIYANILNRPMEIALSPQTVALGAAIIGGAAALKGTSGFSTIEEIQKRICKVKVEKFYPQTNDVQTYGKLYRLYNMMHDSFGIQGHQGDLYRVMKELLKIKRQPDGRLKSLKRSLV